MRVRIILSLMLAAALPGCAERLGDSQAEQIASSDFSMRYASAVLPPGVRLDFPFELTSERLYTRGDSGETRRGLMLEFLDHEPTRVVEEVKSAFAGAGYRVRGVDVVKADGRVSFTLAKDGSTSVFAEIRPAAGRALDTPNALGTVWLSWRVRDGDTGAGSSRSSAE